MDEIGKVATDFNHLISAFRETVSSAKNTSAENADVASELSSASHSIGDRVSEQTKLTQVCVEDGLGLKKILESSTKEAQATVEEIESANKKTDSCSRRYTANGAKSIPKRRNRK